MVRIHYSETYHHLQQDFCLELTDSHHWSQIIYLEESLSSCNGLNVYVPLKFLYRNPNHWYDGVRRWGLEEVIRFTWGRHGLPNEISVLISRRWDTRVPSPSCEEIEKRQPAICMPGRRPSPRTKSTGTLDLPSSKTVWNKGLLSEPHRLWYFVLATRDASDTSL